MNYLYLLPLIAALIGWLTNYLAIKMLFHPKQPINLGIFVLQGVFPKRQEEFAQQIGQIIAEELFSVEDVRHLMDDSEVNDAVKGTIEKHVDEFINQRFSEKFPMLSSFVSDDILQKFKNVLMEELDAILPEIMETYAMKMEESVDVQHTVARKVAEFSSDKLEALLFRIMKKEFRFVEFIGAVVGFFIGLVQLAIVQL
jgi:uncharacterized membrane protein YheB (UPF0754 family)